MSDQIKHECGIALVRLLQPLEYYLAKYGSAIYGLNKLHLLMEKQHNRGQDGAGIACVKFDMEPGNRYINRARSNQQNPIDDIFRKVFDHLKDISEKCPHRLKDSVWLKEHVEFTGELLLGHLRYGTFGRYNIEYIHPVMRENNWITRNLVLAGNFNLTNMGELFDKLVDLGQYPVETSDTVTILEKIGHFLDEENENLYQEFKKEGLLKRDISGLIARHLNIANILTNASKYWDGGYVLAGLLGHGDAFVLRDPAGIRPAFYYQDEEIIVAASERPSMQTTFNIPVGKIRELPPGKALIIKKEGSAAEVQVRKAVQRKSCSFERIYFSRGTDTDIYQERKRLGRSLVPAILEAVQHDLENTVFSYIPNTAAVAFYGMLEALNDHCNKISREKILNLGRVPNAEELDDILSLRPRIEKVAVKDAALRTFITADLHRDDLVAHVYDITYGTIRKGIDNLVVLDDSIVRGTTLKQSILRILARLEPRRIIVASSAPQIRYPDCYGIDMTRLGDFVAFQAAIALLKDTRQDSVINEVYRKCKEQEERAVDDPVNHVREIYKAFRADQLSEKISALLTPKDIKSDVLIVYQKIEDLHTACPNHTGDWYFTGDYPTPGGNRVACRSFINYIEKKSDRAY
ncbi:MAG TPA: amidophosphoribosyltransferase [Bacteroidales bacterium]|nr:amidophosphoribosyltransferase [Bacteroidales bacterium]HSA44898.1 amidophosphoribosyltransferase [Bacteroidales bacterium]